MAFYRAEPLWNLGRGGLGFGCLGWGSLQGLVPKHTPKLRAPERALTSAR